MSYYPTFRDGKRTIDYILVYKISALSTEAAETKHKTFINTLQTLGLNLEEEKFSVDEDVIFVKVHAPDSFIFTYAALFDIELACQSFDYRPYVKPPNKFLATPLTDPNVNDPIYSRAPETMSGVIPTKITSAERIMVVNQILQRGTWGEERSEYGISKLIYARIFIDAFPLHDGDYKWTVSGPLNDRQILALYWGSADAWTKAQPLNLVEKYFGTEHALYFAWLGTYIQLLFPAAILSIFVMIYGFATMPTDLNMHAHHICKSDIVMCPKCHFKQCPMELLSNSCYIAHITYLFDNFCAVIFSGVMSLWATIFMEFWQREESVLQLQWNVRTLEHTISLRPEFLETATKKKYSPVTGKMEPYIPKKQKTCQYLVTLASVALLLVIMILATFGVMVYRVTVKILLARTHTIKIVRRGRYRNIIASFTGALMSGTFIFIFKEIYERIALTLTNWENHRTHCSYSNAYIYKSYALAFTNNYAAVFYIAFFKGKFYTHPGDLKIYTYLGGINSDVCDPTGCVVDLAILLVIIMVLKAFVSNVTQVIVPKLRRRFNATICQVKSQEIIPQWENEYLLAKAEEFFIVREYMDMVIQYGFVNFFVMGFPLAPVLALINNLGELRVDASKVTKSYRRPIPTRVAGLGAWFGILQATTYIGVVTNALVIAFTSTFMEKIIWGNLYGHLPGYLNQTLSVFDTKDLQILDRSYRAPANQTVCYYQAKRYPPNHPLKYHRRKDYWQHLGWKFAFVVLFEHIVVIIKGIVAYAIPDVPFSVKQQVIYQEKISKKEKMMELNKQYMKQRENVRKKIEDQRLRR